MHTHASDWIRLYCACLFALLAATSDLSAFDFLSPSLLSTPPSLLKQSTSDSIIAFLDKTSSQAATTETPSISTQRQHRWWSQIVKKSDIAWSVHDTTLTKQPLKQLETIAHHIYPVIQAAKDHSTCRHLSFLQLKIDYEMNADTFWKVEAIDQFDTLFESKGSSFQCRRSEGLISVRRKLNQMFSLTARGSYLKKSMISLHSLLVGPPERSKFVTATLGLSVEVIPDMQLSLLGEAVHHRHKDDRVELADARRCSINLSAEF